MSLTNQSTGTFALDHELNIERCGDDRVIAIGGNPNVGKSTIFNSLTGLNQHTGNWPGKTVINARGNYQYKGKNFILVDIPGTYSLMANSQEEEVARDFICFGDPDVTVIVLDATCLERNLNLVLQTLEITNRVVVCVNLLDEARRKKIHVNLGALSKMLHVQVVGTSAVSEQGLDELMEALYAYSPSDERLTITYPQPIEEAIEAITPHLASLLGERMNVRWTAIKLLDGDVSLLDSIQKYLGFDLRENEALMHEVRKAKAILMLQHIGQDQFRELIVSALVKKSEQIANDCVMTQQQNSDQRDRKIDKMLTSKATGIPIMILLLCIVFWITISGANIPSELLSSFLFSLEEPFKNLLALMHFPLWAQGLFAEGMYRTLAWVVSVMLPPMAIFFPLFSLLEDLGYLPRVAFNLDHAFKKAGACGKQALTMCMGFGCNAAGIVGCRIIDSPRERLMAICTNNFVPCNGRFPTMIAIITMFFVGASMPIMQTITSTLLLMGVILLGVMTTFKVSSFLNKTILKGVPSTFILELPPYRKPQIMKTLIHSIFDRTLFVLGRAMAVAAPAGILIWLMANITIGNATLLVHCAQFLDPFARLCGLDGYILLAFILGFPANEIVIPILIMSYMATGSMIDYENILQLKTLFVDHGWTWVTAICTLLFTLMHWPCATTLLTIKKETQSWKWTGIAFLLPTLIGLGLCMIVNLVASIFV